MGYSELAKRVKELALENDLDYARITPVARFANAPEGHRPSDLLPGARSVVSMGIRLGLGVQLSHRIAMANRRFRHVSFSYQWFGYGLLNMHFLDRAAFLVARLLGTEGYVAVPIVASGVEAGRNFIAPFSNRHAAVASGMGEFGWNGLCVTPDAGPRARFVSVITTAELDPDPMYDGPKLCDLDKCRELGQGEPVCLKVCPLHAFSNEAMQKVVIGDREFNYAFLDKLKCLTMGQRFSKKSLGLKDIKLPRKFNEGMLGTIDKQIHPQQKMEAAFYYLRAHGCGLCFLLCPINASEDLEKAIAKVPRTSGEKEQKRWN